ncbi:MAG: hypothetical protein RhofKO_36870 [Rhodothermales bacterium]
MRVLKIVAYNVLAVLLLALVIEGGVRIAYPEIKPPGTSSTLIADSVYGTSPGLRPGVRGLSHGAMIEVDAQGFIQFDQPDTATAGTWLFLGDSVTMGIGVAPDSTFAGRFAAAADSIRVLNPSLIGYSVYDYAHVLSHMLNTIPHLDRVVVFWCLNDLYQPTTVDPNAAVRRRLSSVLTFLRQHVRTFIWAKHVLSDRPRTYLEHDARLYQNDVLYSEALDTLTALHQMTVYHEAVFTVVLLPYEYQLRGGLYANRNAPQTRLLTDLSAAGIAAVDAGSLLNSLKAQDAPSKFYLFGDGIHFSSQGHQALATVLATPLSVP